MHSNQHKITIIKPIGFYPSTFEFSMEIKKLKMNSNLERTDF